VWAIEGSRGAFGGIEIGISEGTAATVDAKSTKGAGRNSLPMQDSLGEFTDKSPSTPASASTTSSSVMWRPEPFSFQIPRKDQCDGHDKQNP
jgi:hypothetical protein